MKKKNLPSPRIYYDLHEVANYLGITSDDIAVAAGRLGEIYNGELIHIYEIDPEDEDDDIDWVVHKMALEIREVVGDNAIHYWW
jgi:hypothetical protein